MSNRLRNTLVIALVVSVAINLLLVGIGIGQRFHPDPPMMRMNPMMGLTHFTHELPEERREALADALKAFRAASRPAIGEMRALQQRLQAEIRRDPIDPAALKAALLALQSHMHTNQATSADAFVQLMQALTPAERKALDRSMRRGPPGFRGPPPPFRPPEGGDPMTMDAPMPVPAPSPAD